MFRPNRIGTPLIHAGVPIVTSASYTLLNYASVNPTFPINIVNPTGLGDFGQTRIHVAATSSVASNNKVAVGCQFTISPPVEGDAVGIEIIAGISLTLPQDAGIYGVFGKLDRVVGTTMGGALFDSVPTIFPIERTTQPTDVSQSVNAGFITQVVVQGDATTLSGNYGFGFGLEAEATAYNLDFIAAQFAVRQLNDQQNISYRDTRR